MATSVFDIDRTSVFLSPKRTLLGKGVAQLIGQEARTLGCTKVLIVTDRGLVEAGVVGTVEEVLRTNGIETGTYDGVQPEPPSRIVDEAAGVARGGGYDGIVGVGGGSSLDVAKGVAIMATNAGRILDYVGVNAFPRDGLAKILIPTTAGTGSEATWVSVVTDEAEKTKKSLYSGRLLPDVAILDPLLTVSMPPVITADTGFDALVHAIESFVSVNRTPYTEILAIEAIRLIARSLPAAYGKANNLRARYEMLLAANLAGMAFTSGGLGATHGLAYALGTEYHMSHGRSNAIMLPHVMKFNVTGNLSGYCQIAEAMGEKTHGLSPYESAMKSVEAVEGLLRAVDIPYRLTNYGIGMDDIPRLVEGASKQARFFVPNPRDVNEEHIGEIYRRAL